MDNKVYRVQIPPVADELDRPLWSVMIPTYNCAGYLRETLLSVLAQAPGSERMQIEVVDDFSIKDDPEAVVREVGCGRVAFFRQPRNVGHVRNFETCLLRSRGELIHLLHGDDRVLPGFYKRMEKPFASHQEIGAAFCRAVFMDSGGSWFHFTNIEHSEAGILEGWVQKLATEQRVVTPAVVVRRAVYEHLDGFDRRLAWSEDWEMWVRIAAHYPVWYESSVLAEYRVHAGSSTGRNLCSGENIRDTRRAIEVIQLLFQGLEAERIATLARGYCGRLAMEMAKGAATERDWRTVLVQLREGWRSTRSVSQVARTIRFLVWAIMQSFRPGPSGIYLVSQKRSSVAISLSKTLRAVRRAVDT